MSTQTEQEKWQAMADAIGWELRVYAEGRVAIFDSEVERVSQAVTSEFRDAILAAIERTHLELAAQEMASVLLDLYRVSPNPYFPWIKKSIEKILKKAGVIE